MITIKERKNGIFYVEVKAKNGEVILKSEDWNSKSACSNCIESIRRNAQNLEQFEKLTSKHDKPYFVLKAKNGQIIGKSEYYESESARDNGIESVIRNVN